MELLPTIRYESALVRAPLVFLPPWGILNGPMRRYILIAFLALLVVPQAVADRVRPQTQIERAVWLEFEVLPGGIIEGELINTTEQRVNDIEVLVRYAWIWHNDFAIGDDDPGWATTYVFPIDLEPGQSSPLTIPPTRELTTRDDGHYSISAKVMGYTRYRWVQPGSGSP